jgi:hypothetical protein
MLMIGPKEVELPCEELGSSENDDDDTSTKVEADELELLVNESSTGLVVNEPSLWVSEVDEGGAEIVAVDKTSEDEEGGCVLSLSKVVEITDAPLIVTVVIGAGPSVDIGGTVELLLDPSPT